MSNQGLFYQLLEEPAAASFAIADTRQHLPGGDLAGLVPRVAAGLQQAGLAPGDRVAIKLPNRVECAVTALAVSLAGGIFTLVENQLKEKGIAYILDDCGATIMICQADDNEALGGGVVLAQIITLDGSVDGCQQWEELTGCLAPLKEVSPQTCDAAAIFYTSGSTGFPRGVTLSHANLRFTTWSISTYLGNRAADHILVYLPLSFDYGFFQITTALQVGAKVFLGEKFFAQDALLKIAELGITGLPMVPSMFAVLFVLRQLDRHPLPTLRYVTNTAQGLPLPMSERFRSLWPQVAIFSMYGLTETTRTLYLPPTEFDAHPGSVGKAIPGTTVWLENEQGQPPGPGQPGELMVSGPHVMVGYWGNEEATAERIKVLPNGRRVLMTNDLFVTDDEGRMFFQGRKDDLIKVEGRKVYPLEVEREAVKLPGIQQACIVGRPDSLTGERLVLYLVPEPEVEIDRLEIIRQLKIVLEDAKVPRQIVVVDEMPLTGSGKVDRKWLRDEG